MEQTIQRTCVCGLPESEDAWKRSGNSRACPDCNAVWPEKLHLPLWVREKINLTELWNGAPLVHYSGKRARLYQKVVPMVPLEGRDVNGNRLYSLCFYPTPISKIEHHPFSAVQEIKADGEPGGFLEPDDFVFDFRDEEAVARFDRRLAKRLGVSDEHVREGVMVKFSNQTLWVWAGMAPSGYYQGAGPAWTRSIDMKDVKDEYVARLRAWSGEAK